MHIDDLSHRGKRGVTEFVVATKQGPDMPVSVIDAAWWGIDFGKSLYFSYVLVSKGMGIKREFK